MDAIFRKRGKNRVRLAAATLAAIGALAACGNSSTTSTMSVADHSAAAAESASSASTTAPPASTTAVPSSVATSVSPPASAAPLAVARTTPAGTPTTVTAPPSATRTTPRVLQPSDLDSRAWLDAGETPLNSLYHWGWATMLPPANPGHFTYGTGLPCVTTTLDALGATAVIPHDTDPDPALATQDLPSVSIEERLFVFPDAPKAAAAFTTVRNGMDACLGAASTPTAPGTHATAHTDSGASWASYPQPLAPGVYSAVFEHHDYLVVKGQLVAVLAVGIAGTGTPDPDFHTQDDQNVLASISQHLALYS